VNVLLVWIIFPIFSAFATYLNKLDIGMYLLYFSVANGLMHVVNGIRFAAYNPGLIISFFLNVIIGLYGIMVLQGTGDNIRTFLERSDTALEDLGALSAAVFQGLGMTSVDGYRKFLEVFDQDA